MERPLSRRALLAAAGGAVVGGSLADPSAAGTRASLAPVSMAMHIHGSFSEGIGSYEGHLDQAAQLGVDVIWWTDHDFRVAAHGYRQEVHFRGLTEPENGLDWKWKQSVDGALVASSATFVEVPERGMTMRLAASGAAVAGGGLWMAGEAWNLTYATCLADTSLELDVLPEIAGPGSVCVLSVELSYHPVGYSHPAGIYRLRYVFGPDLVAGYTTAGLVGTVDLPSPAGVWTRHRLTPVDDIRRLWPDLVAEDNSLRALRLGVIAPPGLTTAYSVDRLVFSRHRREGQSGEELRAEVLKRYEGRFPTVRHHRAYEISLVRHLNWYGGDRTLPAFPSPPIRDNDPALTASMVDYLHSHGGVVCWNHPLDVETRESLARLMIERNKLGVDLVEIGRLAHADLLWVYDVAARNALFFTAVGASDDHDGVSWWTEEEHFLTYAWAKSTDRGTLVAALKRGSAWYVDPARYRGALDLRLSGESAMGGVAVTSATKVGVVAYATELPADGTLEVITGLADLAGVAKLAPATTVRSIAASTVKDNKVSLTIRPEKGVYVRTQVRTADGAIVGVSNPLWLLRRKPPHGIPSDRRR